MKRVVFSICCIFFCSAFGWGQTWKLTETMTATLDNKGVLTISTTKDAEAMPDFVEDKPWYSTRDKILSVVIGENVTTIGASAFGGCTSLVSVTIPNSVTSIGYIAFYGCSALTSITIPNSVRIIGNGAFSYCRSLTTVAIPSSVTDIGYYAFSTGSQLKTINVDAKNLFYLSDEGVLYNKDKTLLHTFPAGKLTETFDIPNTVTTIGMNSFRECRNLISITIPNSVITIQGGAFYDCSSLLSVTIPSSATNIEWGVFADCIRLQAVKVEWTIPLFISNVDVGNIFNNVDLSNVTLHVPPGTKEFYQTAPVWKGFRAIVEHDEMDIKTEIVWNLTSTMKAVLDIKGVLTISTIRDAEAMPDFQMDQTIWKVYSPWYDYSKTILGVVIENKVTTIGNYAFLGCNNLTSVIIPNTVTIIGKWAFYYSALTSVAIPYSATIIGDMAFRGCNNLTSVTIPKSVLNLGWNIFQEMTNLKDIKVEWERPLSLYPHVGIAQYNGDPFGGLNTSSVTLHVPTGTKSLYQAATSWKDFGTIVEYTPVNSEHIEVSTLKAYASNCILTISGLQAGESVSIYSVAGQLVYKGIAKSASEQIPLNVSGIYIVAAGNQTIKVIL